jgi:adenylosuccinate synthase
MKQIVLISGHICSGKSRLAQGLAGQFGFRAVKTSAAVRNYAIGRGRLTSRIALQTLGDEFDRDTDGRWVCDEVSKISQENPGVDRVVVDAVRIRTQIERFRERFGWRVVHVHLSAPMPVLEQRFGTRKAEGREADRGISYGDANLNKTEKDVDYLIDEADLRIDTSLCDAADTLVRVAARLGLYAPPGIRCVDVIVGGQYGSEGKGHIAAYLAKSYPVLVRVGGPNAGHTVASQDGVYTYHHLPSGCRDTDARVVVGPGAVLDVPKFLIEASECGLTPDRLFVDPQAMTISEADVTGEGRLATAIASTQSGTGLALARKIASRGDSTVVLARDVPDLQRFLRPTYEVLEGAYQARSSILLEGTQGSGLSLHHGKYPFVTSRDTNVAGCLAEAGISPTRVRRVLMVIRTHPIRVESPKEGTSGPLKKETTFEEVSRRAGLDPEEVARREITSTTRRRRRVGEFDWEQFRHACALNAPTDIVLTFADYIRIENRLARRFEQLTTETIRFVEELEMVAHAPVSLINTRFDPRSVIDRRNWV